MTDTAAAPASERTPSPARPTEYMLASALIRDGLTPAQWRTLLAGYETWEQSGDIPNTELPTDTGAADVARLKGLGLAADYSGPAYLTRAGLKFVDSVRDMLATFRGAFDTGAAEGAEDWWVCPCGNHPGAHGLLTCTPTGEPTEDASWTTTGRHYVCAACGRYGPADERRAGLVMVTGVAEFLPTGDRA